MGKLLHNYQVWIEGFLHFIVFLTYSSLLPLHIAFKFDAFNPASGGQALTPIALFIVTLEKKIEMNWHGNFITSILI